MVKNMLADKDVLSSPSIPHDAKNEVPAARGRRFNLLQIMLAGVRPTSWGIAAEIVCIEIPLARGPGHNELAWILLDEWNDPSLRLVRILAFVVALTFVNGMIFRILGDPSKRWKENAALAAFTFLIVLIMIPRWL